MRSWRILYVFVAFLAFAFVPSTLATGYKVLHAFEGTPDGGGLYGLVAIDAAGNLYGTTSGGGAYGEGTLFELSPDGDGHWTETILHSFCPDWPQCSDGAGPVEGLVIDSSGNLYGPTRQEVFQLAPGPSGWDLTVIHDEGTNADLTTDGAGNLYGEIGGGDFGGGAAAELSPGPAGWTYTVLFSFCHVQFCHGGTGPSYGLSWDKNGNLYGVTGAGGTDNFGVVFKLKPTPSGWKEHVLHNFHGAPDGEFVQGGVVVDGEGRVYGTTEHGGTGCGGGQGCGLIYQITQQPGGHWKEKILHDFPNTKNGASPTGALAIDAAGSLYGVAGGGGGPCSGGGCGMVYKMQHNPDDTWTYKVLHRFQGADGIAPLAGVILDAKGNLYGTTSTGGKGGYGVVFKIVQ